MSDQLKTEGNRCFKNGDFKKAIDLYSKALDLLSEQQNADAMGGNELGILYKNRAMAWLKVQDAARAYDDCEQCLRLLPNDTKAMFRQVLALEQLDRFADAYRLAKRLLDMQNGQKNVELQTVLSRLYIKLQAKSAEQSQMKNKVTEMMRLCFEPADCEREKRELAFDNLMVLARDSSSIPTMLENDLLTKLSKFCATEKNNEMLILAAIRLVGEICKSSVDNIMVLLRKLGISWFIDILDSENEDRVNSSMYCIQTILNTLSGMRTTNTSAANESTANTKPNEELCERHKKELETILICLTCSINNVLLNGLARDAVIELVMRNVHYTALNWAERFLEVEGIERLLECVCEMDEFRIESSLRLTKSTKIIIGACLSRVYENMYYDEARARFMERVERFVKSKLIHPDFEWKVKIVVAITVLLRSTIDVGSSIISRPGIMNMILAMTECETELEQRVSLECLIAAASKKDKAQALFKQAVDRLKVLYKSPNKMIAIRALVSLCKIGSVGGLDASIRPFKDGSTLKLTDACLTFLRLPATESNYDAKKWASEGLAYLTMDAEVKEKLIEDPESIRMLLALPKNDDETSLYGVVTTLVNLCNAYDKPEVLPEMREMAKFAKYHVPEDHELDDEDFVRKRIDIVAGAGVVSSLTCFAKTPSFSSRELIARVLNAICAVPEHRGRVVQQGGAKMLLKFANEGSDRGKRFASQALARIAITMNPEVALPGERALEVVRPLLSLLHADYTALENFEALMALCNLASLNETVRNRIWSERGLSRVQIFMFEEHEMLKRAAVQVITNLMLSKRVRDVFEAENDLVKYLMILCADDDVDTAMAASGALCIFCANCEPKACAKIFEANSWLDSFQFMLTQPSDLAYRAIYILGYVIESSRDAAQKIIETNLLEVLMALSLRSADDSKVKEIALDVLKKAEKWGLIKQS